MNPISWDQYESEFGETKDDHRPWSEDEDAEEREDEEEGEEER